MADTRSNMQLAYLNSKLHDRKSLQNLIDRAIGVQFYPHPGSLHYQQLHIGHFHEPNYINCDQNKKSDIKKKKYPVHAIILQNTTQIRSKKNAQLYYLYLYGRKYADD